MRESGIIFERSLAALPKRLPRKPSAQAGGLGFIGAVLPGNGGSSNRRGRYSLLPYKKMSGVFALHAVVKWNSEYEK